MKFSPKRVWLCLPLFITFSMDVILTLVGQSEKYWDGQFSQAQEFNPLANFFLRTHPFLFVSYALVLISVYTTLICFIERSWTVVLAFIMTFGHAIGAGTWMTKLGWTGYVVAALWLFTMERLLTYCWRNAGLARSS